MLTVASSGLFLVSSYQFYRFSDRCLTFYVLQYLFLALWMTSSIHHHQISNRLPYKYKFIIGTVDRTQAHIINVISVCFCLYHNLILPCLFSPVYVTIIFYKFIKDKPLQPCLHCSIHIVANLGVMSYLYKFLNIN